MQAANPDHQSSNRTSTPPIEPPALASAPRILDRLGEEVTRLGVAGERRVVQIVYLAVTTRLLTRIVSLAVKGPSSAGKSYLVSSVLRFFPPSAYHALSSMSERALIYDETDLRHRMLVIYEASGLESEMQTYLMRSLLSEGVVRYTTVEATKGGLKPRMIQREGPTGLITTTTAVKLHAENETRLVSVTVSDSPAQTRAVLRAQAREREPAVAFEPWHELQTWLEANVTPVRIPYLETLAEAIPTVGVRLRRDFPAIGSFIRAHALLHQVNRERGEDGAVIASFEDYAVVHELVADLVADAVERTVSPTLRETVDAVAAMDVDLDVGVSASAVGNKLGLDKSAAHRRVRQALDRGYLRNLEERRFRPARLVVGEPMPDELEVLPAPDQLKRLHGCAPDRGDHHVKTDSAQHGLPTGRAVCELSQDRADHPSLPDADATVQPSTEVELALPVESDYPRSAWDPGEPEEKESSVTETESEEDTIIRMFSDSLLYMDGQYGGWAPYDDLSAAAAEAFKSELSRLLAEPLFRRYAGVVVRVESDAPKVDFETSLAMLADRSLGVDARLSIYRAALETMRAGSTTEKRPQDGRWLGLDEFCFALEGLLAMPGVTRCVDAILYIEYIESYFRYLDDMDWLREVGHPLAGREWTWTPKEVMDERIEAWEREHPELTGNRE